MRDVCAAVRSPPTLQYMEQNTLRTWDIGHPCTDAILRRCLVIWVVVCEEPYHTQIPLSTRLQTCTRYSSTKGITRVYHGVYVAPVAYQVTLGPGIGQLREFEPRRVHTRINSLGFLFVHKLTCGKKARERELATLDEKSTSSGIAEPYAR